MTLYEDVLGRTFNVPDPVAVAALARSYRGIAQEAGDAQAKLTALASPQAWAGWTGQAADTFSQKIGVLPGQLGKACDSYGRVAWALTDYAAQLEPVVSALTALVNQASDAQGTLDYTVAARDRALQQGQDPQATGWDAQVAAAQAEVSYFGARLAGLLDKLSALSQQCVTRIRQAQAEGIQHNAITDLQVTGLIAGKVGIGAVNVVKNVGDDLLVHPFTQLAHDIAAFDPARPWESWGKIAGDLAGVVGLLAVIPVVGEVAGPLALVMAGAAVAMDAAAVAAHEKGASWSQAGADLCIGLASAGIGRVLGGAVTRDNQLLAGAVDHGDLGKLAGLVDGTDAQASASSLLKAGVQHAFSFRDVPSADGPPPGFLNALTGEGRTFLNAGADGYTHSPAAVDVQHLKYTLDRAKDVYSVYGAQQDKGGQPLWQ
jgi:uncharacterized protein YukE